MNADKLPRWLNAAVASAGGLGIFLVAFLDSSVLSFPVVNDLLVIRLSILNPSRMPYYALMATLGSLLGCLVLYFLARKGEEVMFHKHAGVRAARIRHWLERNGFLTVLVAALLPPPLPFKVFVVGAGAFSVRLRDFVLALVLARSLRYLGEGIIAVRYGDEAIRYFTHHKLEFSLLTLGGVLAFALIFRLVWSLLHRAS